MKFTRKLAGLMTAALMLWGASAIARDWGKFPGYELRVKLIGGAQYEPLYAEIPKWEAATGAKVEILSRKNHFELDREIKQDIAASTIDYCLASNHTSFAPQYGDIYVNLRDVLSKQTLDGFVQLTLSHSTVDGNLVQQSQQTQDLMQLFMVLGTFFTFFAAIVCSYFIRLSRADIDNARRRIDASTTV